MLDHRTNPQGTSMGLVTAEGNRLALPVSKDESDRAPLLLHNLLNDFAGLVPMLGEQLQARNWLDAYLLSAGINQITEDYLHRDFLYLGEVASRVARMGGHLGRVASLTLWLRSLAVRPRSWAGKERLIAKWQARLATLVQLLAEEVAPGSAAECLSDCDGTPRGQCGPDAESADRLVAVAAALAGDAQTFPQQLRHTVLGLPSCFRYYDLQPADCLRLVRSFAACHPDRYTPILVVGVRTAGSYLAPLCAAFLKEKGYRAVGTITLRPGQVLLRSERHTLAGLAQRSGFALVADDPPRSGSSLASVADQLRRVGVPTPRIALLCPVHGPSSLVVLPACLRAFEAHILPWDRWAVHDRLTPDRVRQTLAELLVGRRVSLGSPAPSRVTVGEITRVEKLVLPEGTDLKSSSPPFLRRDAPAHRHIRALFRVELVDGDSGGCFEHLVYVKGTGLGYFGRYSMAIAGRLARFLPEIYGLRGGLLYRLWLPEEHRLSRQDADDEPRIAERVAAYVSARHRLLGVARDPTTHLLGVKSLWQAVAKFILSPSFGRLAPLAYPLMLPQAKRLLRGRHLATVDGSMALSQWFTCPARAERGPALLKVDFDDSAYFNHEQHGYDSLFDLACAAADFELEYAAAHAGTPARFPSLLRRSYERAVGERIDEGRWLLYRSLYLLNYDDLLRTMWADLAGAEPREAAAPPAATVIPEGLALIRGHLVDSMRAVNRALARVHQSYYEQIFFSDLAPAGSGPLCAIDVDNVLETRTLGFPVITPAGARALRALAQHGYRVVLATGRSLDEVIERCKAYRLAGGVAEYGSVTYVANTGRVRVLLSAPDRANLARLRTALSQVEGVYVDPDYCYAVRAYRLDSAGRRRGLDPAMVEAVLVECGLGGRVRAVFGASTDFIPVGIDKGVGLRTLAAELDRDLQASELPLAFAVGDATSDLPMLRLAEKAYAPANAEAALRAGHVRVMSGSCQVGLAQAAAGLLGHAPGSCPVCRPARSPARTRLLLRILAVHDAHGCRKVGPVLLFGLRLLRRAEGAS